MTALFPSTVVLSDRAWPLNGGSGGGLEPGRVWAIALIPEGGRLTLDGRRVGAVLVPPGGRPVRAEWSGVRHVREVRLQPFGGFDGPVPLGALPPITAPDGPAAAAMALLVATRGRITIHALARRVGCSERHLRTVMRARLGLGPAEAARLLRVEAALRGVAETKMPLATVALEAGFADQAHMTRALRRHAGLTPAHIRSVQDANRRPI